MFLILNLIVYPFPILNNVFKNSQPCAAAFMGTGGGLGPRKFSTLGLKLRAKF